MEFNNDSDIVRGLAAGQPEAWRACYDAHAAGVWRAVARQMGAQASEVADVVQETFLAAARSVHTFQADRGSLVVWLVGIARRQVALYYRKELRHQRLRRATHALLESDFEVDLDWLRETAERSEPPPEEAVQTAEMALLLRAALTELSPEYEEILAARYLDDRSVEELAQHWQTTETAIRSKLARARRALKEVLLQQSPNPLSALVERDDPLCQEQEQDTG